MELKEANRKATEALKNESPENARRARSCWNPRSRSER